MVNAIRVTAGGGATAQLYIVDCRKHTASLANMAIGGGFESTAYYPNSKIMFMNVENIHVMRDSFRKVFALYRSATKTNDDATSWFSSLESTRWLEHVKALLTAANTCAALINAKNVPILIHCSDGWDRTAQLSALTQILLDPWYRTKEGFAVLVEKEFCSFGHR